MLALQNLKGRRGGRSMSRRKRRSQKRLEGVILNNLDRKGLRELRVGVGYGRRDRLLTLL